MFYGDCRLGQSTYATSVQQWSPLSLDVALRISFIISKALPAILTFGATNCRAFITIQLRQLLISDSLRQEQTIHQVMDGPFLIGIQLVRAGCVVEIDGNSSYGYTSEPWSCCRTLELTIPSIYSPHAKGQQRLVVKKLCLSTGT